MSEKSFKIMKIEKTDKRLRYRDGNDKYSIKCDELPVVYHHKLENDMIDENKPEKIIVDPTDIDGHELGVFINNYLEFGYYIDYKPVIKYWGTGNNHKTGLLYFVKKENDKIDVGI